MYFSSALYKLLFLVNPEISTEPFVVIVVPSLLTRVKNDVPLKAEEDNNAEKSFTEIIPTTPDIDLYSSEPEERKPILFPYGTAKTIISPT